jgi:DNA-binding CsgD family transcriptional regulator/tetratricopeptide (TPR) repeat protein
VSTQLIETVEAPPSWSSPALPADRTLLLLLATEGLIEEWSLLSAASLLLKRQVGEVDLQPLLDAGLVVRRRTCLVLSDDRTVASTLDLEAPSVVASAHAAWARAHADPLSRAWHEAMAHLQPNRSAARRARLAALRLQTASRHEEAVNLFERAAWLSDERGESARLLVQGAACAFVAGLWGRASGLLATARRSEPDEETARVMDLLEESFRGGVGNVGTGHQQILAVKALTDWGQTGAAFAVMAASHAGACNTLDGTGLDPVPGTIARRPGILAEERREVVAMAALSARRSGLVSLSFPALQSAAREFDRRGERGLATIALALLGEAATSLGHVPAATEALERAASLSRHTGQHHWQVTVELSASLLRARKGRPDPADADVVGQAALSGDPARRDLAGVIHAVTLLADERWVEGYDVLATLAAPPRSFTPDLLAWGLLSHLADAAVRAGRVPQARALVSSLGAMEGACDNDVGLAELIYATAVLSDDQHRDACFEALLSYDLGRWPWLGARAHLARGEQLRRTRRVVEARRHLVIAQRVFKAMGALPWERRAAQELRAAGVREVSPRSASPGSLSVQELEIAHMAARGLTNREIGTVLSLSPRTVGAHLYRVFPKLGVTKRIQLAIALEDER